MILDFIGHAAFLLRGRGEVLIDPYLTENPLTEVQPEELEPDLILVTHAHHDHLGDAIDISRRTGAPILTTPEVASHVEGVGATAIAAHMGGVVDTGFCEVKLFPAWHSSSIDGRMLGVPVSFVISMDGVLIYHAGDTALFGDMTLIGEEFDLDLALLPIGGRYTMGPDDALRALRLLHPKNVVPMHYDTFDTIRLDPSRFCSGAEEIGIRCHPLPPGGSLEI